MAERDCPEIIKEENKRGKQKRNTLRRTNLILKDIFKVQTVNKHSNFTHPTKKIPKHTVSVLVNTQTVIISSLFSKDVILENKNTKAYNSSGMLRLALVEGAVYEKGSSIRFKIESIGRVSFVVK